MKSLRPRLRSVNEWHTYSDKIKAKFTLFDSGTREPTHDLKEENLIKIDVPGIGNPSGSGYDWTKIVEIQTGGEERTYTFLLLMVRPCSAPDATYGTVAHFYSMEATNMIIVRRVGTCFYAEVHGRNETENTSEVPILDTVRNKAVTVGTKLGLDSLNWLGFTKALLKPYGQ